MRTSAARPLSAILGLSAVVALVAGCATTPDCAPAHSHAEEQGPVDSGQVDPSPIGPVPGEMAPVEMAPVELGVPARAKGEQDSRLVHVEIGLLHLPRKRAVALLSPSTARPRPVWVEERPGAFYDTLRDEAERRSVDATFPVLSLHSGERGNISVLNQQAYVSGFDVLIEPDAAIADPQIDVLQEGFVLDIEPRLTVNGNSVRLLLEIERSEVLRPIEEREGPVGVAGASVPVTVQMPVVVTRGLEVERVVPIGSSLVLGLPGLKGGRGVDLFVLRPTELTPTPAPHGALRADLPGGVKELVVFGLLGGFTTFSAFGYEVEELLREGETARALLYVAASVLLGVLLAFAGRAGVLLLGR
jgi:hypothetical protein